MQGATGLGAGIVKKFVHEGAKVGYHNTLSTYRSILRSFLQVVILDFNLKPLDGTSLPDTVKAVQGDVTSPDSWKEALQTALTSFGKLDIVCNNAGIVTAATVR